MLPPLQPVVWAFDAEWVPCAASGRRLLGLGPDLDERDVFGAMWAAAGATAEQPRPFLKLAWCRLVSVAVVERRVTETGVEVRLCSLPRGGHEGEADVIRAFVGGLARRRPQLVGFNSHASDLPLLRQRALAHGIEAPGLCARPERPWTGPDYGHPYNDWNVDLLRALGGRGAACPPLADLAALCGIPAKRLGRLDVSGEDVAGLWLAGRAEDIRHYSECDALTTFLLWVRAARVAGRLSAAEALADEGALEQFLEGRAAAGERHLQAFLEQWRVAGDASLDRSPLRVPEAEADMVVR